MHALCGSEVEMNPISRLLASLLVVSPRPFRPLVGFVYMVIFIVLLSLMARAIFWAFGESRQTDWRFLTLVVVGGASAALTFGFARDYVARSSSLRPYIVSTLSVVAFFGSMMLIPVGQPAVMRGTQDWLLFGAVVIAFGIVGGVLLRSSHAWRRSA